MCYIYVIRSIIINVQHTYTSPHTRANMKYIKKTFENSHWILDFTFTGYTVNIVKGTVRYNFLDFKNDH